MADVLVGVPDLVAGSGVAEFRTRQRARKNLLIGKHSFESVDQQTAWTSSSGNGGNLPVVTFPTTWNIDGATSARLTSQATPYPNVNSYMSYRPTAIFIDSNKTYLAGIAVRFDTDFPAGYRVALSIQWWSNTTGFISSNDVNMTSADGAAGTVKWLATDPLTPPAGAGQILYVIQVERLAAGAANQATQISIDGAWLTDEGGSKPASYAEAITPDRHEQYLIPTSERVRSGVYAAQIPRKAVSVAAQVAPAGYWWLANPIGSSVLAALRRIEFISQFTAVPAAVIPTSPRLLVQRFTHPMPQVDGFHAPWVPASRLDAAISSERIYNPSFDPDLTGWSSTTWVAVTTFARQTGWAYSGAGSVRFTVTDANATMRRNGFRTIPRIPVVPGETLNLSAQLNVLNGAAGYNLRVEWADETGTVSIPSSDTATVTGTGTKQISGSIVVPAGAVAAMIGFYSQNISATPTFDGYIDEFHCTVNTNYVAPKVALMHSQPTAYTLTPTESCLAFLPVACMSAAEGEPAAVFDWKPQEDGRPVIRPGEGLLCTQPDAGTTGETARAFVMNISWEEYTVP